MKSLLGVKGVKVNHRRVYSVILAKVCAVFMVTGLKKMVLFILDKSRH